MMLPRRTDIADPSVRDTDICTRQDIADWLGVTVSAFDFMRKEGRAPKSCMPEKSRPRWIVGDVRRFYGVKSETESNDE